MITLTSAEAQNNFGKLLDTAQREPVVITRHGRVAAVVVSPEDMVAINAIKQAKARAAFQEWSGLAAKSMTPAATELTEEQIVRMVHEER
jgi:antitoxin Phd